MPCALRQAASQGISASHLFVSSVHRREPSRGPLRMSLAITAPVPVSGAPRGRGEVFLYAPDRKPGGRGSSSACQRT